MPFDSETSHASPTGATLRLFVKHARGTGRGVIQINHGLAEHAARYARFADIMAGDGFHVYAHDHRGHGATTAPDAPLGNFGSPDGSAKVIADVDAVHDLIAGEHPGSAGHRLRPFDGRPDRAEFRDAAFRARAGRGDLERQFFGRPARPPGAGDPRLGTLPPRLRRALAHAAEADLPGLGQAVPDRRTAFDWLSRDAAEVDKYVADPLCGWDASVSMWRDVFEFIFPGADDAQFRSGVATRPAVQSRRRRRRTRRRMAARPCANSPGRLRAMGFSNL